MARRAFAPSGRAMINNLSRVPRYQTLDVGRSLPGVNYIPLPKIGEGLGEWSEALSYGKRGMGKMRDSKALPCDGVRGFPRKCPFEGVCWSDNDD